ncbi:MAG TPA: hypothetical protein VFF52_11725, partial [Isosphaeraceae bacterium]|nr:hypothetical protein [Isosphaeraceae bacterium]
FAASATIGPIGPMGGKTMSNPSSSRGPQASQPTDRRSRSVQTGIGPDPDAPNPFGPDAPNVRDDDPAGGQVVPEAPPPKPPVAPLDHGDFAPDEP